ncbi:hypothetical protein MBLNU230_g0463t1 [Neophaeotheca triangularis]
MADSDYEHWPEDGDYRTEESKVKPGYDANNGLHTFSYKQAPPSPKAESIKTEIVYVEDAQPTAPKPERKIRYIYVLPKDHPAPPEPVVQPEEEVTYIEQEQAKVEDSRVTYCYTPSSPVESAPKSTYYTYGKSPAAQPPKESTYQYVPAVPGAAPQSENLPWTGRTKAQVEEDNMKIAFNENVNRERKMAPVDTKEDEVFWVVELDGSQTLRSHEAIQGMNGHWREDPRFKSWYFLREKGE